METSLPADIDISGINISGYNRKFINVGNGKGKGMVTFYSDWVCSTHERDAVSETMQITKYNIEGVDNISVYRSSNHSMKETCESLMSMIDADKPTLITGDFNVCTVKNKTNSLTAMLETLGFKQLVNTATHIGGGHIDHCYWLDETRKWEQPSLERYSPYWTDHDGLLVTLKKKLEKEDI